jgi:hypothetical protein
MAKVVYNGFADFRELEAADLKKADVSGFKKTSFAKGVPVEVSDEVAKALTENSLFSGFKTVSDDTELDIDLVDDTTPTSTASQSTSTVSDAGTTSGSTSGATTAAGDGGTTGGSTTAG